LQEKLKRQSVQASTAPSPGTPNNDGLRPKSAIFEDAEIRNRLENKVAELQKANVMLNVEITEAQKKFGDESVARQQVEQKLRDLEVRITAESQSRSLADARWNDLIQKQDLLHSDFESMVAEYRQLKSVRAKQDSVLNEQKKTIAMLELDRDELQEKIVNANQSRMDIERQLASSKENLQRVIAEQISPADYNAITEECLLLRQEIESQNQKFYDLKSEMHTESENSKKQRDMDQLKINELVRKLASIAAVGDDGDGNENGKRVRLITSKMKALQQKLNHEVSKRNALESELAAVKHAKVLLEAELDDTRRQGPFEPAPPSRSFSPFQSLTSLVRRNSNESMRARRMRPLIFPGTLNQPA
jgi:hypothetical protein